MEIGVATTIPTARGAVAFARVAEEVGFDAVGFVDTAPHLYQAVYPTATAGLLATSSISIGPYVTNFATQHWSVHACTARTLDELAPGRFFLGLATGDGAVHSIGLKPVTLAALEDGVREYRAFLGASVAPRIRVAASGPKAIAAAGRVASDVVLGVGIDHASIEQFAASAVSARRAAGVREPLGIWVATRMFVVDDEDDVAETRAAFAGMAVGNARYMLAPDSSYEGKNVPAEWEDDIRTRLRQYSFSAHGVISTTNPNGALFDDRPAIKEYFIDRMGVIGTSAQCRARIHALQAAVPLDGLMVTVYPTPAGDQLEQVRKVAAALETDGPRARRGGLS